MDNVALVPASQLESLDLWEAASRQLPAGSVLVVLQPDNWRLQTVARELDKSLRLRGRRAHLLTVSKLPDLISLFAKTQLFERWER